MTTLDDTRHCPMLIEADRKRCGEIISELYNKTECSASLAVDAGSQLQNLLSVVDAQDGKILELEQRVKVLTDAANCLLKTHAASFFMQGRQIGKGEYVAALKQLQNTVNSTPKQTAAQIERWHVEWMMKLPSYGCFIWDAHGGWVQTSILDKGMAGVVELVAIPPLPKESDSPETDLDEALRRQ